MKTFLMVLVGIVLVALIGHALWKYAVVSEQPVPQQPISSSTALVAGEGEHCGGNMIDAPVCDTGYQCEPEPGSHLPFGDVGGICVAVQATGGY